MTQSAHSQNRNRIIPMATLETDRLLLRPFREDDLDDYAAFASDSEVMRYVGGPLNRLDAWRQIAMILGHWQLRGYGLLAVERKDTGAFVGRIGFINPEGWPGFELGWLLCKEHWGNGFATEGALAAMNYAFETLDQPHVISLIHPANVRSVRVAERLGETIEGRADLRGEEVIVYGRHRTET